MHTSGINSWYRVLQSCFTMISIESWLTSFFAMSSRSKVYMVNGWYKWCTMVTAVIVNNVEPINHKCVQRDVGDVFTIIKLDVYGYATETLKEYKSIQHCICLKHVIKNKQQIATTHRKGNIMNQPLASCDITMQFSIFLLMYSSLPNSLPFVILNVMFRWVISIPTLGGWTIHLSWTKPPAQNWNSSSVVAFKIAAGW